MKYVEKATLAGGCFWGMQEMMRSIPGVTSTLVGYMGGSTLDPSYSEVKTGQTGHAEAVQICFHPEEISYNEILDYFFRVHDPTTMNRQGNDYGTQYRSVIFYHTEDQRQQAFESKLKAKESGRWKDEIVTSIVPASKFYPAEDYHQDYLQKHPNGHNYHWLRD